MSGTFPSSPAPASIEVSSIEPTLISVTSNLTRQARSRGGQRWSFRVSFAPMTRAQFDPIFAFSVKQRGQYETFTWVPTTIGTSRGESSETPVVDGALSKGVTTATIKSLTASTSNIMRSGDFFKFTGHSKVYMCTADMSSDSGGAATLDFVPKLTTAVADEDALTISSVPFTVAFTSDIQTGSTNATSYYAYGIDLIEVP